MRQGSMQAAHPLPSSPIKGEVPFSGRGTISPQEWRLTSPLMGEAGRGWSNSHQLIHLIPLPKTSRIILPSPRMGGLQANSGGVGRVGALPLPQVRVTAGWGERPQSANPGLFQKPAPRGGFRLIFIYLRGESRLGVRPSMTTASQAGFRHVQTVQNRVFPTKSRRSRYTAFLIRSPGMPADV